MNFGSDINAQGNVPVNNEKNRSKTNTKMRKLCRFNNSKVTLVEIVIQCQRWKFF